jgi:hypothetical protein
LRTDRLVAYNHGRSERAGSQAYRLPCRPMSISCTKSSAFAPNPRERDAAQATDAGQLNFFEHALIRDWLRRSARRA